jgi:hypothetical protein
LGGLKEIIMNTDHIITVLDNTPLGSLSEDELRTIRSHSDACADCARAFEAAQLASLLLRERTSEAAANSLNANPFFQTRVLAAWREQQATNVGWNFGRLWNATRALVASMAVTTATLAVLSFVAPASTDATAQTNGGLLPSSPEAVVMDQRQDDMTTDQVLSAIYEDENEGQ